METPRRRQHHSCDQCRKGKRGCDAPKKPKDGGGFSSCSNCRKYKKQCTFNWLSSKRTDASGYQRKLAFKTASTPRGHEEASSAASSQHPFWGEMLSSSQWHPDHLRYETAPVEASNLPWKWALEQEGADAELLGEIGPGDEPCGIFSWDTDTQGSWQTGGETQGSDQSRGSFDYQQTLSDSMSGSLGNAPDFLQQFDKQSQGGNEFQPASFGFEAPAHNDRVFPHSARKRAGAPGQKDRGDFCVLSDKTADEYARSTMTQNLIRIYHDSMENALSCWLTERTCPYSDKINDLLSSREKSEWGPNWSNRICTRVCRLDRASSSARGRSLSFAEDRTAARVLHMSIIAFASQWAQHFQKDTGTPISETTGRHERSIRENVWNQARHALERSSGIPSFRIIFANIIFSLTQRPQNDEQDIRLGELLENDRAPIFLETALRQLFTYRFKLTRLQRGAPQNLKDLRRSSAEWTLGADISEMPDATSAWEKPCEPSQADPILASNEHRNTFSLLFWLGVMFDTLTAAMYQRPLVVSDEDSQITAGLPPGSRIAEHETQLDLDGWNTAPNQTLQKKQDLWGDLFLHNPGTQKGLDTSLPSWPCSYEEAAAVLTDAAPVKVLLFRRVTQLQTLVYRGAEPESLEEAIQRTLFVYRHWNCTYKRFMLDCMANHAVLPPRIQSWYVILAAHWHLAAMLLGDVVESIDQKWLGSDSQRESRRAINFVSTLRRDNAFAVAGLAQCSLYGQGSAQPRQFHDSLNEAAFLTEPWTVVLIHSFAKAGYILVDELDMSPHLIPCKQNGSADRFRQSCEICIRALRCIARKSDMASLVARNLSKCLDLKLRPRRRGCPDVGPECLAGNNNLASAVDPAFGLSEETFRMDDGIYWR